MLQPRQVKNSGLGGVRGGHEGLEEAEVKDTDVDPPPSLRLKSLRKLLRLAQELFFGCLLGVLVMSHQEEALG